jgi:hypothetical protein
MSDEAINSPKARHGLPVASGHDFDAQYGLWQENSASQGRMKPNHDGKFEQKHSYVEKPIREVSSDLAFQTQSQSRCTRVALRHHQYHCFFQKRSNGFYLCSRNGGP